MFMNKSVISVLKKYTWNSKQPVLNGASIHQTSMKTGGLESPSIKIRTDIHRVQYRIEIL